MPRSKGLEADKIICEHQFAALREHQFDPAKLKPPEGAQIATPGFPALQNTEEGPSDTVNRIRAGASSMVSVIETGKLQQNSENLKEAKFVVYNDDT